MIIEPARQASLVSMFLAQAAARSESPFLWSRDGRGWSPRTWASCRREVSEVCRGLRSLGLARGDRVVLASENRPEWLLADLAIMAVGGTTVPAYPTDAVDSHRHVLGNTKAHGAIVSTPGLLQRILAAAPPELKFVVCLDPMAGLASSGPALYSWESVREAGRRLPDDLEALAGQLTRRDLACIQHTSGTGGLPKGAMLSHGAILCDLDGARHIVLELGLEDEVFLSFLPASHVYEHTVGQYLPVAIGAQIYYLANASRITAALPEVRPSILIAVPRFFETMHRMIIQETERRGMIRRGLLSATVALGSRKLTGGRLSPIEAAADRLLEHLVRGPVRARFGGRLKAIVSGGAPISPELVLFFHAVGLRLLQGYGLTEASPVVTANPPSRVKFDSVGPVLPGVEVRLAADGEILVRGELVMDGYWNDAEASAAALRDGWLHTGDIGVLDEDGYLRITDRKRDFIKTTGGEMVAPQRIEGMLMLEPEIEQAVVFGDGRSHLVAILVPDQRAMESWAAAHGVAPTVAACAAAPGFHAYLHAAVDKVNRRLGRPERVRRFHVAVEPFTIDNDLLTPTLKLRRNRILDYYREEVGKLYDATGRGGGA
jgi:long-chain acyl-CoA synthetase